MAIESKSTFVIAVTETLLQTHSTEKSQLVHSSKSIMIMHAWAKKIYQMYNYYSTVMSATSMNASKPDHDREGNFSVVTVLNNIIIPILSFCINFAE